jgi:hypothetical protein
VIKKAVSNKETAFLTANPIKNKKKLKNLSKQGEKQFTKPIIINII